MGGKFKFYVVKLYNNLHYRLIGQMWSTLHCPTVVCQCHLRSLIKRLFTFWIGYTWRTKKHGRTIFVSRFTKNKWTLKTYNLQTTKNKTQNLTPTSKHAKIWVYTRAFRVLRFYLRSGTHAQYPGVRMKNGVIVKRLSRLCENFWWRDASQSETCKLADFFLFFI